MLLIKHHKHHINKSKFSNKKPDHWVIYQDDKETYRYAKSYWTFFIIVCIVDIKSSKAQLKF